MKQVHFVHYRRIITILALVSLFVAGNAWGISGRLGEFGVGDSVDVPYHVLNCSGSKRAVSADSVTYHIYKDTLGHYAMPVDSGKVTATTAPSFAVSAGRGFVNYFLRICANAGNHAPGRYTAWIEAWDDTCSQMHNVWWDCYADSTTHEYAKNNRLIAGAVKAKTDSSSFGASGLIKSTPQTDVTLGGATYAAIAAANWVYATRKLTHFDEDDMTVDWDATLNARSAIGDTNTNPFDASVDSTMHTTSIPVFVTGTPDVNMAEVGGDAGAAENLEKVFDGDSTTAARADFAQVTMIARGDNSHALWKKGIGSGYGEVTQGGATGAGVYYKGFGAGRFGVEIISEASNGIDIQATGGSGVGINIDAGLDGVVIDATEDGIDIIAGGDGLAIYGDGLAEGWYDIALRGVSKSISGTIDRCTFVDSVDTIISPSWSWVTPDDGFGTVDSVSTTTSVHDSTNFTDVVDNFYNGMFVQFTTGQNKGLTRLIEDFGNYGEFTVYPALPYAPAETDEFRIMSLVVGERRPNIIRIVD